MLNKNKNKQKKYTDTHFLISMNSVTLYKRCHGNDNRLGKKKKGLFPSNYVTSSVARSMDPPDTISLSPSAKSTSQSQTIPAAAQMSTAAVDIAKRRHSLWKISWKRTSIYKNQWLFDKISKNFDNTRTQVNNTIACATLSRVKSIFDHFSCISSSLSSSSSSLSSRAMCQ